jgi:hypothetical protein
MKAADYHAVTVFKDFKFSWPRVRNGFVGPFARDRPIRCSTRNFIRSPVSTAIELRAQLEFATLDRVRGPGDPYINGSGI